MSGWTAAARRAKAMFLAAGLVPVLLALGACAESETTRQPRYWQADAVLLGPEREDVEVRIFDIPPGEQITDIVLIGPEGSEARPVDTVERDRIIGGDAAAQPTVGVGVAGGSSGRVSTGVGISFPIFGSPSGSRRGTKEVREIAARIPIPDPAAYREDPDGWRIEITALDIGGNKRTRTLRAPR